MKKPIPFIALALCGAMLFAAPKKEKIPITRIYDEVLGISDYVCEIYEFQNGAYIKEIPAAACGEITTQEALAGYKKIAEQKKDMAAMMAYAVAYEHVTVAPQKQINEHCKPYIEFAASKNFAPAIYAMAFFEPDFKKQSDMLKKSAELGWPAGAFYYVMARKAAAINDETQTDISPQEALSVIEKTGFPKSESLQIFLAELLYQGYAIPEDKERAIKIYQTLIEQGSVKAATDFYYKHSNHELSEKEYSKYFVAYKRLEYEERQRIIQKTEEALPYLEKRAQKGDAFAMYRLAQFYKTYKPYIKFYKKYLAAAADAGHQDALEKLAENYSTGANGFERNKRKQFDCLLKLYRLNGRTQLYAISALIDLCIESDWSLLHYFTNFKEIYTTPCMLPVYGGVEYVLRDYHDDYSDISQKEIFEILKEIADTNFDENTSPTPFEPEGYLTYNGEKENARLAVAFCYHEGIGTQKNLELAKEYGYKEPPKDWQCPSFGEYQKAQKEFLETEKQREQELLAEAQNGDGKAMAHFAGWFCEEKPQETIEWLEKSIATGFAPACDVLANFYKNGWSENPDDYKKCAEYYKKGIALGYIISMRRLGLLYLDGFAVPFDPDEAQLWLSLAYRITGGEEVSYNLNNFPKTKALLNESIKNYGAPPRYLGWQPNYKVFIEAFKNDAAQNP